MLCALEWSQQNKETERYLGYKKEGVFGKTELDLNEESLCFSPKINFSFVFEPLGPCVDWTINQSPLNKSWLRENLLKTFSSICNSLKEMNLYEYVLYLSLIRYVNLLIMLRLIFISLNSFPFSNLNYLKFMWLPNGYCILWSLKKMYMITSTKAST